MKRLTLFLMVLAMSASGFAVEPVCRIQQSGGVGSGCFVASDAQSYYALTNAHVAGARGNKVMVTLWENGAQSGIDLAGEVVFSSYAKDTTQDVALVRIPKSYFQGRPVTVIPLAGPTDRMPSTVRSAGCAKGAWPTGWTGRVISNNGPTVNFIPPPAGGRSGSPLFSPDGSKVVGMIGWRSESGGTSHGMALTAQAIRRIYAGENIGRTTATAVRLTQCPGGQCPIPGDESFISRPPYIFFPNIRNREYYSRQQQPQQPQPNQGGGLFPSVPSGPQIDTSQFVTRAELETRLMAIENGTQRGLMDVADAAEEAGKEATEAKNGLSGLANRIPELIREKAPDLLRGLATSEEVQEKVGLLKSAYQANKEELGSVRAALKATAGDALAYAKENRSELVTALRESEMAQKVKAAALEAAVSKVKDEAEERGVPGWIMALLGVATTGGVGGAGLGLTALLKNKGKDIVVDRVKDRLDDSVIGEKILGALGALSARLDK